ncbi:MAG: hypothetical protein ACTSYC_04715 [Promethearchaeota archaeon]
MTFCGNVVELVEKKKVYQDNEFVSWKNTNLNEIFNEPFDIEVFIEKKLLNELNQKPMIIIDAAIGETENGQIGMLFIKKNKDVY